MTQHGPPCNDIAIQILQHFDPPRNGQTDQNCEGFVPDLLRRAEAVEPVGIIRPLRIAEIGRVGRKRVGLNRLPIGIGQIRAGFHHYRLPAGPIDVETEFMRAGAGSGRQHLRSPKRGMIPLVENPEIAQVQRICPVGIGDNDQIIGQGGRGGVGNDVIALGATGDDHIIGPPLISKGGGTKRGD